MEQNTIDNGNEFVIDTKTQVSEDSIYFKDNGDHISVAIEPDGGTYIIYKKAAADLHKWLGKHL